MRRFLALASVLVIILPLAGCTEQTPSSGGLDFSFTTLDGQQRWLHEYYGKVLLVDLMGVACQPCQAQMFVLDQIQANYSEVVLLSINVWTQNGETRDDVLALQQAFEDQVNITLDWTFGLDDTQGTIGTEYASQGVPTMYILDLKGNIYYFHVGYEEYATLSQQLDELLA